MSHDNWDESTYVDGMYETEGTVFSLIPASEHYGNNSVHGDWSCTNTVLKILLVLGLVSGLIALVVKHVH